jgi:CRP/FNR family transcriptional regulator
MLEVAAITREKRYEKSETIYSAGKREKGLFVIHTGTVKISRLSPTGKVQVIRVLGPGEFMGELAVLNSYSPTDFAEALDPCTMCVIEGEKLKLLMNRYPSIALKVMEELSLRLERAEDLIEDINLHSAEKRLAEKLLELSEGKEEFELPLSKGDLASQLGMTQETLSRRLAAFRFDKFIELKGQRRIVIRDRKGLAEVRDTYLLEGA